MCGIVGYTGKQKAYPILINGLKALEYRGYDSAGIALFESGKLKISKEKGRVKNLDDNSDLKSSNSSIGIAHTRWATHGVPSSDNAHPHLDNSGNFAVVHNGIIENYLELKEFLSKNGYKFKSETDTEVIPNLIHYYYEKEKDFLQAFNRTIKDLKGSYAILVLSPLFDGIYVAKMNSPLVIGEGEDENFIASDIPAVLEYTKNFYFLNDGDLAYITNNSLVFYNNDLKEVNIPKKVIDWDKNAADKNGYEDFMLKEIFEQPRAINETLAGRIILEDKCNFLDINIDSKYLKNVNKIYIVACGTAMHAGRVGKTVLEELTDIVTIVDVASEFRYNYQVIDKNTLCIFISQSGETADTIAALKLAKKNGAKTIAISNVIGSSITREADYTIYTHAGPEIAVASTKAYVSQISTISALAIYFAEILQVKDITYLEKLKKELLDIPEKIDDILKNSENYKKIAKDIHNVKNCFYIGRGNDYTTAMEGSLKLKEIAYIHSEAYPAGELKHGPIALIEDGTSVIGIITNKKILEKTISNLQEVITRGAKVVLVTDCNYENNDMIIINIPKTNYLFAPILAIVPLQLIAYYVAKEKNLDVDKPRNLAKSVTVE
ncbi:MAG: glutamine--fructose-6-phosphate transaminase (isomerizing) [Bacilli bacterium]|jgi:glucosamine--fructose-6-phosphate aminotransferase (isomerizing)|nr:glutamine--fructose-6-phosphate transaminase (isomerizing) [Bacilli bacterium]